jgi:hypothetical protein
VQERGEAGVGGAAEFAAVGSDDAVRGVDAGLLRGGGVEFVAGQAQGVTGITVPTDEITVDNGAKWRGLPADFPPWETVYGFFWRWNRVGVVTYVRDQRRRRICTGEGRCPHPVTLTVDSESRQGRLHCRQGQPGIRRCEKDQRAQRHITVDTLGLPVLGTVTPADIEDRDAARDVF